jgi:uncharacterized protein YukE
MTYRGMDADAVEQRARQLKAHAASVGGLVTQIEREITGLLAVWEGPDAQQFVNEWWPQHKKALISAQHNVDGLGQSALNNASEQRRQSSATGGSSPLPSAPPSHATPAVAAAAVTAAGAAAGAASGAAGKEAQAANNFVQK